MTGKREAMERIPEIKLEFFLEKLDAEEMEWQAVTDRLGIQPAKRTQPRMSKGTTARPFTKAELETFRFSQAAAGEAGYHILLHAAWSVTLPKMKTWALEEPMAQMRKRFWGKGSDVRALCAEYRLAASLTVHIYADTNTMPEVELSESDMAFWSSMGATVNFDFALD